jgi:hypothetical protein
MDDLRRFRQPPPGIDGSGRDYPEYVFIVFLRCYFESLLFQVYSIADEVEIAESDSNTAFKFPFGFAVEGETG